MGKVVIITGSQSDLQWSGRIAWIASPTGPWAVRAQSLYDDLQEVIFFYTL